MALTSPPTAVAPFDKGRLNAGIDATATTLYVSPIFKTVNGVRVKQGINTTSGCAIISAGDYTELVTYTGASVDSTTKVTTITGLTRGRDPTQTTSSSSFAGGTGRVWAKGAKFTVVADATYFQSGVFTNVANTFSARQTFSAGARFSGTTDTVQVAQMTTAQRDAIGSPTNGMIIYNTDDGVMNQYIGGAWTTFASGTTSNAANNTGGKVDLATAAEVAAGTATDATSGSPNVIPVSIVKTSSTGAVNGTVPALNAAVALDVTIGGTGRTSATTGSLLVGAGTSAMTIIGPGSSGQVPVSNGTTIAMAAVPYYSKIVYIGAGSSSAVAGTTEGNFDTHTYTIPANDLISGVGYRFTAYKFDSADPGSSTFKVKLGTTVVATMAMSPGNSQGQRITGEVFGTTSAGASAAVNAGFAWGSTDKFIASPIATTMQTANVATNGTLALQFSITKTNSVSSYLMGVIIERISTTAS